MNDFLTLHDLDRLQIFPCGGPDQFQRRLGNIVNICPKGFGIGALVIDC